MRIILRILFGLMVLAGMLLGIALPQAAGRMPGKEIGRWQVWDAGGGFRPFEAALSPGDAPVFITVLLTTLGPIRAGDRGPLMELSVTRGDELVLERPLRFDGPGTSESPQSGTLVHQETPGPLETVDGSYQFSFKPASAPQPAIRSVELVLNAGAVDIDPRAQPAGYTLIALGFVGYVLTLRRVGATKPLQRRWGRGGNGRP